MQHALQQTEADCIPPSFFLGLYDLDIALKNVRYQVRVPL